MRAVSAQEIVESDPEGKTETFHPDGPDLDQIPDHFFENIPEHVLDEARAFLAAIDANAPPAVVRTLADAAAGGE